MLWNLHQLPWAIWQGQLIHYYDGLQFVELEAYLMNSSGCWGALDLWLRALCSRTPGVRTIHYVHSLRTVIYALAALQTDIRMQTHLFSLYTYGICCIASLFLSFSHERKDKFKGLKHAPTISNAVSLWLPWNSNANRLLLVIVLVKFLQDLLVVVNVNNI